MMALGMIVFLFGYASLYWAIQAIQGKSQNAYLSYLLPFAK